MIPIGLSLDEITMAAHVGLSRNVSAIRDRRNPGRGRTDAGWEAHCNGAIAEYVVAKALGVTWMPVIGHLDTDDGDVEGLQVRSTAYAGGHLILKEKDPEGLYVLVVLDLRSQSASIRGWVDALEARDVLYWRNGTAGRAGGYWVPQSALHPWSSIPAHTMVA